MLLRDRVMRDIRQHPRQMTQKVHVVCSGKQRAHGRLDPVVGEGLVCGGRPGLKQEVAEALHIRSGGERLLHHRAETESAGDCGDTGLIRTMLTLRGRGRTAKQGIA